MQQLGTKPVAFTLAYSGNSQTLVTDVHIAEAFDVSSPPAQVVNQFKAVWDTGATNSVITENVVTQCGLVPTGRADVNTAQGSLTTDTFQVGIFLPNKVAVPSIRVSKGVLVGIDVLIGMDIIGMGDFAVTNKDGKTVFSFRMPSMERIDFVEQTNLLFPAQTPAPAVSRSAKCPCGSGKKYKRCHGS